MITTRTCLLVVSSVAAACMTAACSLLTPTVSRSPQTYQGPVADPQPAASQPQVVVPTAAPTGQFRVIVLDPDGQFLHGATVAVTCLEATNCTYSETGTVAEAVTFSGMPADQSVALQVRATGYEPLDRTVLVKAGANEDQVFKLVRTAS